MKILHVLKSNAYSGAENVVITICRYLKSEYEMAYTSPEGSICQILQKEDIEYYPMKKFGRSEVNRVLEQFQPDIIHAHDFSASVICAACKGKRKLISHLHNNAPWIQHYSLKSLFYREVKRKFDKVLLVSEAIRKEAVFFKGKQKNIQVIGNPLDKQYIFERAMEGEFGRYDILFLGRLSEAKNPKRFIRIVNELIKENIAAKVGMIGDGELRSECISLINEYKLSNYIDMLGFRENPYPYVRNARLVLVTSDWEGYGLVAVETLALGIPVLVSDAGGLKNIFLNLPEAVCCEENEFVEKAGKLLTNQNQYIEYKEKIEKYSQSIADISDYMYELQKVYERLMNED